MEPSKTDQQPVPVPPRRQRDVALTRRNLRTALLLVVLVVAVLMIYFLRRGAFR